MSRMEPKVIAIWVLVCAIGFIGMIVAIVTISAR